MLRNWCLRMRLAVAFVNILNICHIKLLKIFFESNNIMYDLDWCVLNPNLNLPTQTYWANNK